MVKRNNPLNRIVFYVQGHPLPSLERYSTLEVNPATLGTNFYQKNILPNKRKLLYC